MRIRLLDGAHEEQHAWNSPVLPLAGGRLPTRFLPWCRPKLWGISESFSLHIDEPYQAGDYLYYFGGIDDVVGPGLWGIRSPGSVLRLPVR